MTQTATDTATVPDKVRKRKRPTTDPVKDRKHIAYAAMVAQGMSKSQAAQSLGYSIGSIGSLDKSSENKTQKNEFLTESRIRRARRVVDSLMAGEGFGKIESVKDSTALKAAESVLDRAYPKAQEGAQAAVSFTQINLNVVAQPERKAIDVSDTYVCDAITT
jgi:hypothetical protein